MSDISGPLLQLGCYEDPPRGGTITFNVIDSSSDQSAVSFNVRKTESIARVGVNFSQVVAPPVLKISLQGLSTTARGPDGTIKGGGSPSSATFTPAAGWQWVTLDNAYTTAVAGEWLSIVVEYSSGTVAPVTNFASVWDGFGSSFWYDFPKWNFSTDSGSNWTKEGDKAPIFGYGDTATAHGHPFDSFSSNTGVTVTSDRRCNKFTIPGSGGTFGVTGMRSNAHSNSGTAMKLGIWNAAGTELASVTKDQDYDNMGSDGHGYHYFDSVATCDFGTPYYLGIENLGDTCRAARWIMDAVGDQDAYPLAQECYRSDWDDSGGTWSDTTTERMFFDLILSDLTLPGGGPSARIVNVASIGTY